MMAIQKHGVVAQKEGYTLSAGEVNVLDSFPSQSLSGLTETSSGLNLPQMRIFIARGAGRINGILTSRGLDPDNLEDDQTVLVQGAIVAYTVSKSLIKLGRFEQADRYQTEHDELIEVLVMEPEQLGESDASSSRIKTNVPTGTDTSKYYGRNFGGF